MDSASRLALEARLQLLQQRVSLSKLIVDSGSTGSPCELIEAHNHAQKL